MTRRCNGAAGEGPPRRNDRSPAKDHEPHSPVTVARPLDQLAARRELPSWAAAAARLNQFGYAAAVPGHLAAIRFAFAAWWCGPRASRGAA